MMAANTITPNHVDEVCKLGHGEACCAFLVIGGEGFVCSKGTEVEATIRQRLEMGLMGAKGDNCEGWTSAVLTPQVTGTFDDWNSPEDAELWDNNPQEDTG